MKQPFKIIAISMVFSFTLSGFENSAKPVWPSPPDPARFIYERSVSKAQDLEISRGFWKKVWDFLAGNEEKVLQAPFGLYVGADGKIGVTDSGTASVFVFDTLEKEMDNYEGFRDEHFLSPIDIDRDGSGNFYISDSILGTVFVLDKRGKSLRKIGNGQLKRPTGIAIDRVQGIIYIADTVADTINVYTLEGEFVKAIGSAGKGEGKFNRPTFLTLGKDRKLYVVDSMNQRIQIFDPSGKFIRTFGQLGNQIGDLASPRGIAVDKDGNIYVSDTLFHAIQIFNPEGKLLLVIGGFGSNVGEFSSPKDLAIDANGSLYISDHYNQRIQILKRLEVEDEGKGL